MISGWSFWFLLLKYFCLCLTFWVHAAYAVLILAMPRKDSFVVSMCSFYCVTSATGTSRNRFSFLFCVSRWEAGCISLRVIVTKRTSFNPVIIFCWEGKSTTGTFFESHKSNFNFSRRSLQQKVTTQTENFLILMNCACVVSHQRVHKDHSGFLILSKNGKFNKSTRGNMLGHNPPVLQALRSFQPRLSMLRLQRRFSKHNRFELKVIVSTKKKESEKSSPSSCTMLAKQVWPNVVWEYWEKKMVAKSRNTDDLFRTCSFD